MLTATSLAPTHRRSIRPAAIVVPVVVVLAVVLVGLIIRDSAVVTAWDLRILQTISAAHVTWLDILSLGINWLFSPVMAAVVVIVTAAVILLATRRSLAAVTFLVFVVVPWLGNDLIKTIVHRPRPDMSALSNSLVGTPSSLSYPSGHVAFATAYCLALLLSVGLGRLRPLFVAIAIVIPVLTAFSRMYLGVHYLTDVVAALVGTTAAVILVNELFGAVRHRLRPADAR
ncbi:phosphatase PAP2 family protein [Leifsonia sp. NPDC058292]|uniref:phosphatase PAP2 family protein n=1 Tax=Leifsonia sp. NPDC058292 TaxID=3346428 RepID=UPI0036DF142B